MEPKYAVSKYNYSRLTELIRRKMRGRKFLRLSQGRSQLDNWGGGADTHTFVLCTINFF